MNLDVNTLIEVYKDKVNQLANEVILLQAILKSKEKEIQELQKLTEKE